MDNRVTFELLQAARAYRVRSAKLLARVGLYPGQDALLKLLDQHGRMTMGEAAAALSIQPPTVNPRTALSIHPVNLRFHSFVEARGSRVAWK